MYKQPIDKNACGEAIPCNQTSSQFNALERAVLENEKLMKELEDRLAPILRSESETPINKNPEPPREHLVPLADALRNVGDAAIRTNTAILSLLKRAEI